MTYVRGQSVEQIYTGKATFATLLLPPQTFGPTCPAEMGTQCRSQACPLPREVFPGAPCEASQAHDTNCGAAHTAVCFRPEPGEYIPTQTSSAGPQARHISPLSLQSLHIACPVEVMRMDKTNLFLIQCEISYSWLFFS